MKGILAFSKKEGQISAWICIYGCVTVWVSETS